MNIELSLENMKEIVGWADTAQSEGDRVDWELISRLNGNIRELERTGEIKYCRCCDSGCCSDPDHCCQSHTCGIVNDRRPFEERYQPQD